MIKYAESVFTRTYQKDNKEFYATFHPEVIVERENFDVTGRYLVVFLHPQKGLQSFFFKKEDSTGKFALDDYDGVVLEDEYVDWCNAQIG